MKELDKAHKDAIDLRNFLKKQYPNAETSIKVTYWRGVTKTKVKIKIHINQ